MSRTRRSAKAAGTRFETLITACLAEHVDDRIERRRQSGARDRGDISGWRYAGLRICGEIKDVSKLALGVWVTEAEIERGNDSADVALVIHKRRGHGDPLDQYVTCTLRDLITLITQGRP